MRRAPKGRQPSNAKWAQVKSPTTKSRAHQKTPAQPRSPALQRSPVPQKSSAPNPLAPTPAAPKPVLRQQQSNQQAGGPQRYAAESHPVIYLTFDDGPSARYTPQVLALLKRYHAHAVFCEIGTEVRAHPELTRLVVAGGHRLCDHTLTHDERLRHRSLARIHYDVDGGLFALHAAAPGVAVPYFRAPGGAWSPSVRGAARRDGMVSLTWTVDPRDWSRPGVPHILSVVRAQHRHHAVVLLHDGGGPREQTLAALRVLLPELAAAGYRFELPPPSMFIGKR